MGSEIIRIAEQAHMAGQYSAGVDPSYSEARAYCSGLEFPTVDELKAHIELLREVLFRYAGEFRIGKQAAQILMKTPAQSLNHIRAQVEEETIRDYHEWITSGTGGVYESKYK